MRLRNMFGKDTYIKCYHSLLFCAVKFFFFKNSQIMLVKAPNIHLVLTVGLLAILKNSISHDLQKKNTPLQHQQTIFM